MVSVMVMVARSIFYCWDCWKYRENYKKQKGFEVLEHTLSLNETKNTNKLGIPYHFVQNLLFQRQPLHSQQMKKLMYFKERIYIQTNAKNYFVSLIFVQNFTHLCKRFSLVFPSAELKFALLVSKFFTYTEPSNSQINSKHNNNNSKKAQKLK